MKKIILFLEKNKLYFLLRNNLEKNNCSIIDYCKISSRVASKKKCNVFFFDDISIFRRNIVKSKINVFIVSNTKTINKKDTDLLNNIDIITPWNKIIERKCKICYQKFLNKISMPLIFFLDNKNSGKKNISNQKHFEINDYINFILKLKESVINKKNSLVFIRTINGAHNKNVPKKLFSKPKFILTKELDFYKNVIGQIRYDNYFSFMRGLININFIENVHYVMVKDMTMNEQKCNPEFAYYFHVANAKNSFVGNYAAKNIYFWIIPKIENLSIFNDSKYMFIRGSYSIYGNVLNNGNFNKVITYRAAVSPDSFINPFKFNIDYVLYDDKKYIETHHKKRFPLVKTIHFRKSIPEHIFKYSGKKRKYDICFISNSSTSDGISSYKNYFLFLKMIDYFEKKEINVKIIVCGKISAEIKKDLNRKREHVKIDVANYVHKSKINEIYQSSKILLVLSTIDCNPRVIQEAICCGTFAITSNKLMEGLWQFKDPIGAIIDLDNTESYFNKFLSFLIKNYDHKKIAFEGYKLFTPNNSAFYFSNQILNRQYNPRRTMMIFKKHTKKIKNINIQKYLFDLIMRSKFINSYFDEINIDYLWSEKSHDTRFELLLSIKNSNSLNDFLNEYMLDEVTKRDHTKWYNLYYNIKNNDFNKDLDKNKHPVVGIHFGEKCYFRINGKHRCCIMKNLGHEKIYTKVCDIKDFLYEDELHSEIRNAIQLSLFTP